MSLALGAHAFGSEPLAGDPLHDPPTVVVDAPSGTVSSGGPEVSVDWTYSQPQGDSQQEYRVLVQDDAGSTTYFDSGWLAGDASSYDVDVDAADAPHDSSDVQYVVEVRGPEDIGTGDVARYEASGESEVVMDWGTPHCTIDSPSDGAVLASLDAITVQWTFSDDDGANTQGAYRVRLLYSGSGLVVHDSGWVESTDTSYEIPATLNDGSDYEIEVQLKNNHGIRSD